MFTSMIALVGDIAGDEARERDRIEYKQYSSAEKVEIIAKMQSTKVHFLRKAGNLERGDCTIIVDNLADVFQH